VFAGAEWSDDRWVVDGKMVTAQTPEDLAEFMRAIVELTKK
jgi:putative intracellular protease/amidase